MSTNREQELQQRLDESYIRIATMQQQNATLMAEIAMLRLFARDIATNYDCDSDAHKYGSPCRACDAEKLLSSTTSADKWLAEQKAKVLVEFATKWLPHIKDKDPQTSIDQSKQNATVDDCIKHAFSMANELRGE